MWGITDLTTYVLGTIAIVLLPGPNSLFVASVAARQGVRAGYRGAWGVFLGDALLMVAAAAGAASVLTAYPPVFLVVKYAGAAYLAWLGLGILRGALRRRRDGAAAVAPAADATVRAPFRRALLISLLNPKAILFFVSFFIQFVDPGYAHPALSFLVLGAILQVFSALYLTGLIFGGRYLAAQFARRRALSKTLSAGVGAVFIAFGVKLATASAG
ncbi:putative membrane protein [Spirilliplanes yamanashiensis]|uniref:Putative membrane protein n=2 Tax=Spirilliplanes yamanashiensis TaxID=42233 RepID=A0A8J4DH41_9ACTN|nr:leucine efflux protein [Spirilliplanes yamanashiensis]GIJ01586.1 putative membrane protein [Spirilliplanes yamanashiensis]